MVDQTSFDQALALIADLNRAGRVFLAFKPPFGATFEINKDVLSRAVADAGVTQDDFKRASSEIGEMILVTLQEAKEAFLRHETEDITDAQKREDTRATLERRLESAGALIDDNVARRYRLKVSSKAPAFASLDWDLKIKTFDAKLGELRLPYATVKISFQRHFELEPETLLSRNLFDSVQINMTRDEVEYLIREFELIRSKLNELEEARS